MKVGVIGAGTQAQGTGPWLAKAFHELGAEIVGVLSKDESSASDDVASLKARFGIGTVACRSPEHFFDRQPELVVIAAPTAVHHFYLKACLSAGVAVLCEKPLLYDNTGDWEGEAHQLIDSFHQQGQKLWVNTQWSETLSDFSALYPEVKLGQVTDVDVELSPGPAGSSPLLESLPHAINLLVEAAGPAELMAAKLERQPNGHLVLESEVGLKDRTGFFSVRLTPTAQQPRPFAYRLDGCRVHREIEDLEAYTQVFVGETSRRILEDPLKRRVQRVLDEARGHSPYNSRIHELKNEVTLLASFMDSE